MKNKRIIYFLLPAVVLIWGLITYRIWQAVDVEDEAEASKITRPVPNKPRLSARPSKLSLDYPDPFRASEADKIPQPVAAIAFPNRSTATTRHFSTAPVIAPAIPKQLDVPVTWPIIELLGTIENRQSRKRVALITISGQQTSLAEKQVEQGIKVLHVSKDSVVVEYQKQRRTFQVASR